jgi:Tol biopolymer transport system component
VSVGPTGRQANGDSTQPAVSADGRTVAFYSAATNLVRGDTNKVVDLFVHDRATGETTRVSVASDGTQGNAGAGPATSCVTGSDGWTQCSVNTPPALSGDGRLVVFASDATNLVKRDRNASADVFLHDRATGETILVSRRADGTQADATSHEPVISADGSVVAFTSSATNLVPEDANEASDVFVLDRGAGRLYRASSDPVGHASGGSRPGLSRDGRVVAFLTADEIPGIVLLTLPVAGR